MKSEANNDPTVGAAQSITTERSSANLSVADHASQPSPSHTGFPKQTGQSLSYWLQQVRNDPLLNHRTTPSLPNEVDTVIIGSGLSGTLIAHHHLTTWPTKSVLILEAREFCSGATGRNAGHCKPDQWRGFAKYEAAFGAAQAIQILKNEAATWQALVKYVQENEVDCDLWVGETMDVPVTDEVAALSRQVFERYKAAGGNTSHITVTHNPEEARRNSRIEDAKACYAWPASTLQPWKLAAHIMRSALTQGANLQTTTLATRITPSPGPRRWEVHTPRGAVSCNDIVHATNAYVAALLPEFAGIVTPKPHICTRVVPPRGLAGSLALENSYAALLPDGGLFSINTRANSDGNVMFGGSNPGQKEFDEWLQRHPESGTDDGLADVECVVRHVRSFAETQLDGWRREDVGPSEGCVAAWSGIIAVSSDGVPIVGKVPGREGQWICGGHHGHGMARIFTAAPGLVKLMEGKRWEETGLPSVYQVTEQRMERLGKNVGGRKVAVV